jgi:SHS2 domain-containing protein
MTPFEFIGHTADIAVRATGDDTADAFAAAADALTHLLTDGAEVKGQERIEFQIESVDLEGLLVGMLSELILRFDADGQVCSDFNVRFNGDCELHVEASCEPVDLERYGNGTDVKGVSYHMLEISQEDNQTTVQVLFDV